MTAACTFYLVKRMRVLLLILLAAASAVAQTPVAAIAPMVVTAARTPHPISVPASVTVLAGDSLRARGLTSVADALRLVPGLTVVSSSSFGSQTSLFMRGGQSNYVRVLLDGAPLNEPGGALDLAALTLDNIERIDVLRGPASVLYGQDATTGVVEITTRSRGGRRAAVMLDAGSYGQRDVALAAGLGGARASVSGTLSSRETEGILPFNNESSTRTASVASHLTPDDRTAITLAARWQAATYHYPTDFDGSIADRNAENTAHRLALSVAGTRTLSERISAAWTLTSSEHDPRTNDGPDSKSDTLGFYGFFSTGTVTRRAADLRFTARTLAQQLLTVGAEIARDHERSSSRSLSQYGPENGEFTAARQTRALYAEAVGAVTQGGTYQIGARLDDNSAFGTFRTLRAAASWRLGQRWQLRASAGSAFRAPSFFENFATGYVIGNPRLAPERTSSGEVGIDGRVGTGALSFVVYRQRFRDLIQYSSKVATNAPNYYNVAGASADGVELTATFPLLASVHGRAQYAYSRTRVTNAGFDAGSGATFVLSQPLVRRPAHSGRFELGRALANGDVTVGAAYTGASEDRNYATWPASPVTLKARTLIDAAVNVRMNARESRVPVLLRLRGDNVTNVQYQGVFAFQAPGRTLRAGVTIGRP